MPRPKHTPLVRKTPLKRTAAKRKPPPTKTQLRRKCDLYHGKIIRSKGACERCGSTQNLQRAHIFSRGYRATEFDDRNTLCLCHPCHFWGHHHPLEWESWVQEHIGLETYYLLRGLALTHRTPDYAELLVELQRRWAEMEMAL